MLVTLLIVTFNFIGCSLTTVYPLEKSLRGEQFEIFLTPKTFVIQRGERTFKVRRERKFDEISQPQLKSVSCGYVSHNHGQWRGPLSHHFPCRDLTHANAIVQSFINMYLF